MSEFQARNFCFSQSNLETYTKCQRRFFLRYVRRLQWPASPAVVEDDFERAIGRGRLFHSLVVQETLGIDVAGMVRQSKDGLLGKWWRNYLHHEPVSLPQGKTFSEVEISVPLGKNRLLARFDRVVFAGDGSVWIVDWKTGKNKPAFASYKNSWQTLVYRYVMAEGGRVLTQGRAIAPEKIVMVYWHPGYPERLQPIRYSQSDHVQARKRLESQVKLMGERRFESDFQKTANEASCSHYQYSAYCERAHVPGCEWEVEEEEMEWALPTDIEE